MTLEVPDTPDWKPLVTRLAAHHCGAFMYMGHVGPVHLYKHVVTRRYLNLDGAGNFGEQLLRVTGARA